MGHRKAAEALYLQGRSGLETCWQGGGAFSPPLLNTTKPLKWLGISGAFSFLSY